MKSEEEKWKERAMEDFPELFENDIDNEDEKIESENIHHEITVLEAEYVKKHLIEELKENIEVDDKDPKNIVDKRTKKSLWEKVLNAFGKSK